MTARLPVEDRYAQAVTNEDGSLKNFTVKFEGKLFRCECRCNVFHKPDRKDLNLYRCNACDTDYRGTP